MAVTLPTTETTGTLITETDYNTIVNAVNQVMNAQHAGQSIYQLDAGFYLGRPVGEVTLITQVSDISNQWLRADGRTIGNGSSGGTARANADTQTLFEHLWDNFTNTELVIQDSSGTPTTRGGDAATDFAANKRMPLPDLRGRVPAGMDDPTGADAANRQTAVAADVLGGSNGSSTHTLDSTQVPNNLTITGTGLGADPNRAGSAHTGSAASAHQNTQPTYYLNYFIYTGN